MKSHGESSYVREELKRTTSPSQIWALALGAMIGWGCFVLPDLLFLPKAGSFGTVIGIILGALAICIIALCCGMLIKVYPVAGGTFAYTYAGLGPMWAFICGWGVVLTYTAAIAANGTALILLFRFLFGTTFEFGYLYSVMGWEVFAGEIILISGILTIFAYFNYRGMSVAGTIQLGLSMALVVGVLALFFGSVSFETAKLSNLEPFFAEDKSEIASVFILFSLAPFLFGGFDTIPQAAEEFNFPIEKSIKLMVVAILSGAAMYCFVHIAIAVVRPYPEMLALKSEWLAGTIASIVFGKFGGIMLAIPVLAAIFSGINGFFMAVTRLLFGMGRSKFLPVWFEHLCEKYNSPKNAILFTWIFVLSAPWLGRPFLGWLTDTMALALGLSYFLATIAAYKLVKVRPDLVTLPFAKLICIVGMIVALFCLLLLSVPGSPAAISLVSVGVCVAWFVLGVGFYLITCKNLNEMEPVEIQKLLFGLTESPLLFTIKK